MGRFNFFAPGPKNLITSIFKIVRRSSKIVRRKITEKSRKPLIFQKNWREMCKTPQKNGSFYHLGVADFPK